MSLKKIIPSTLVSLVLAAAPMQTAYTEEPVIKKQEEVNIEMMCQEPEDLNEGEPEFSLPELTEKYCGYWLKKKHCYWLSDVEYKQFIANISPKTVEENGKKIKLEPNIKNHQTVQYLGFIALMRHKPLIDFVANHYELNPMQIVEIMNHESSFNITVRGDSEPRERGLGQLMKDTAHKLVNKVTDPDHPLFYPHLSKENYFNKWDFLFWKLSTDYKLNIVLTAAMVKTAQTELENILAKKDMTKEELAKRVKEIGQKDNLWYLRNKKSEMFGFYNVDEARRKKMNDFWKTNDVKETDLFYLVYNGGRGSIRTLLKDKRKAVAEVLIYNFTNYSRSRETADDFISLYENGN